MNMKVVVYTFSDTLDNYGQVLQYLATQIFFDRLGCETSLLKYREQISLRGRVRQMKKKLLCGLGYSGKDETPVLIEEKTLSDDELRKVFFQRAKELTVKDDKKHPRHFEQFRKKHFRYTEYRDLIANPPKADVYCVGSDQSWSWCGDENFLNYGIDDIKRISFAPSFGAFVPSDKNEWEVLSEKLQRLDLVTVREESGIEICKKAGRADVKLIPDPTMLLKAEDYGMYEDSESGNNGEYIFLYLLGNPTDIDIDSVYEFAEKEGLEVVYVTSQGREDSHKHVAATIPQWLSYIRHARYVMTNSFHGTAFSIVYNKKFLVFPLIRPFHNMNGRIDTLLDKYGLCERKYTGNLNAVKREIAYDKVNSMRDDKINEVSVLIQDTLSL